MIRNQGPFLMGLNGTMQAENKVEREDAITYKNQQLMEFAEHTRMRAVLLYEQRSHDESYLKKKRLNEIVID